MTCLADIRFLHQAWDRLWSLEAWGPTEPPLLYVTIEDRLPGEQVNLNFQASPAMLEKFLENLEEAGLKFSRTEIVPGFLITCRVEKDRGGLTVIGVGGSRHPADGTED